MTDQVLTGKSWSLMEDSDHSVEGDQDHAPATTESSCQIQTTSRSAAHNNKHTQHNYNNNNYYIFNYNN